MATVACLHRCCSEYAGRFDTGACKFVDPGTGNKRVQGASSSGTQAALISHAAALACCTGAAGSATSARDAWMPQRDLYHL